MESNKQKNVLFKEMDFSGSDKIMILNKPRLLEMIESIYKSESPLSIRENVYTLKELLSNFKADKEGLLNIDTNGDTVKINQRYLFNELKQIVEAQTLERSRYYLRRLYKGVSERRTNKINDLNINRWKEYEDIITDSLWVLNKRDSTGVHRADYWGNFIPQIPQQMMKRYTKKDEWVLDTFVGCGTTLIEAQRLGRNCIGIDKGSRDSKQFNRVRIKCLN